jgi:hypothetical protein
MNQHRFVRFIAAERIGHDQGFLLGGLALGQQRLASGMEGGCV